MLGWRERDGHRVIVQSNQTAEGKRVLSDAHLAELRPYLDVIHRRFCSLYGRSLDDKRFAMEIEFKIDKDGRLSIKQARPWVFASGDGQ